MTPGDQLMHQTKLMFLVPVAVPGCLPAPNMPPPAGGKRRKRQTQTEAEELLQDSFCNADVLALVVNNTCTTKISQIREVPGVNGVLVDYTIFLQISAKAAVIELLNTANENIEMNSNGVFMTGILSGEYYFLMRKIGLNLYLVLQSEVLDTGV